LCLWRPTVAVPRTGIPGTHGLTLGEIERRQCPARGLVQNLTPSL
jgi:hypothetical protein